LNSESAILVQLFVGILCLIVSVMLWVRRNQLDALIEDFRNNSALIYVGGFISLLLGLFIVLLHNDWSSTPSVLVSGFGWLAAVKGALLLIWPELWLGRIPQPGTMNKFLIPAALVTAAIGAIILASALSL
jgi:hypothetical protein